MILTPKEDLIEMVRNAVSAPSGEMLSAEQMQETDLWRDLQMIAEYVEDMPHSLVEVRKALYRVWQHLDPERGLVESPVGDQSPPDERVFTDSRSTPFVLALSEHAVPSSLHDTPLGQLLHQALYNMMGIEEVLTPSETTQVLDLGRQRVYELARSGQLFTIYKKTVTGKGAMTSLYLAAQVSRIKEEMEARYHERSRPGPQRAKTKAEKAKPRQKAPGKR